MIPKLSHSVQGKTLRILGAWKREFIDKMQSLFRAVNLSCMVLQWWILTIVQLPKAVECTTSQMNANVNYEFYVLAMSHWGWDLEL